MMGKQWEARAEDLSRQLADEKAAKEKAEREYLRVWNERDAQRRRAETAERHLAERDAEVARLVDRCEELAGAKDDGATYVLDHLAELLKLERWSIHDGSETWEGDVSSSLYHILVDAGVIDDETGELAARAALSGSDDSGWREISEDNPSPPHEVSVLLWSPPSVNNPNGLIEARPYSTGRRGIGWSEYSQHSWATHWMPLPAVPTPAGGME